MDECPEVAGKFNGCPTAEGNTGSNFVPAPLNVEDQRAFDIAIESIQFNTGSSVLLPDSKRVLNQVAALMNKYPDRFLSIEGHTDNTGSVSYTHLTLPTTPYV